MTPQAYCARLEQALSSMPPAERQEIIRYYLEFLEDASEDERSALGTPEELAQRILRENGIFPPDTAAAPPKHRRRKIPTALQNGSSWRVPAISGSRCSPPGTACCLRR